MPSRVLLIMFFVLSVPAIDATAQRRNRKATTGVEETIRHANRQRNYRVHSPDSLDTSKPAALLLFLHGGGGNADVASRMGMTQVADKHGFVVVYPTAIDKHWNDGRETELFRDHDEQIDDVAFLMSLVEKVSQEHDIDTHRVFAAGVSNGGFMSHRLAIEEPSVFSAVGVIVATMAEPLSLEFNPQRPVSVVFMNGTADPVVPYGGGEVQINPFPKLARRNSKKIPSRGVCTSTDDAVTLWLKRNALDDKEPVIVMLPDSDTEDGSQVEWKQWTDGEAGTSVALYRVIGGGHTVPGGSQYLPERIVGKTNQDIDGLDLIWNFLETHARKPAE